MRTQDVDRVVRLFCCGDVMIGRGVDQILPHPGDPLLHEPLVTDARVYVGLAETINGAVPGRVDASWPWGDALAAIDLAFPDLRLINLETSITTSDDFAAGKSVHYRMNPANLDCLKVARPDICVLANNHVLDFGPRGLEETLEGLASSGITPVGAGMNLWETEQPALVAAANGTRIMVMGFGMPSSGIPSSWAATADRPGINLLPDLAEGAGAGAIEQIRKAKRSADIVVVSIHWGSNWGYQIPPDQADLAHRLVDAGADLIHGHSSHHAKRIEIYRDRLILYGCGDFIDDYEGIAGHEEYRDDLRLLYFPALRATGEFIGMTIVVMQARQLRLCRASTKDVRWIQSTLDRISRPFGAHVRLNPDETLDCRKQDHMPFWPGQAGATVGA